MHCKNQELMCCIVLNYVDFVWATCDLRSPSHIPPKANTINATEVEQKPFLNYSDGSLILFI